MVLFLQAENMIEHRDEIYARPKRTWFMTEKEKKLVAKAEKVSFFYYCVLFHLNVKVNIF